MMAKHTSGPWFWTQMVGDRRNPLWVLTNVKNDVVLTIKDREFGPTAHPQADRPLIAAAPDMAEALLRIRENLHPKALGRDATDAELLAITFATKVLRQAGVIPDPMAQEQTARPSPRESAALEPNYLSASARADLDACDEFD